MILISLFYSIQDSDAFNLDQTGIAGKGAAGGHHIFGENIDTATVINAVIIRPKPGAGIQADNPFHDPIGDFSGGAQLAAIIVNHDPVSV